MRQAQWPGVGEFMLMPMTIISIPFQITGALTYLVEHIPLLFV